MNETVLIPFETSNQLVEVNSKVRRGDAPELRDLASSRGLAGGGDVCAHARAAAQSKDVTMRLRVVVAEKPRW